MRRLAWSAAGAAAFLLYTAGAAVAQDDFSPGRLEVGDRVIVVWQSGGESRGKVTGMSPGGLLLDGVRISAVDVRKVDRLGDPLWNGALIGLFVGSLVGQDDQFGCSASISSRLHCAAKPAIALGVLGALLDYSRVGRRSVFERAPLVTVSATRGRLSVAMTWSR